MLSLSKHLYRFVADIRNTAAREMLPSSAWQIPLR